MAVTLGSTGITFPDATTQTTAATGGGAIQATFTAAAAITAGQTVQFTTGTNVTPVTGVVSTQGGVGGGTVLSAGNSTTSLSGFVTTAYDPNTAGSFVTVGINPGATALTLVAGTTSVNSITVGSVVTSTFSTGGTVRTIKVMFDPVTAGKGMVVFIDGNPTRYLKAIIFTVSGTTLTIQSTTTLLSGLGGSDRCTFSYYGQDVFVYANTSGSGITAYACSISTYAITQGTGTSITALTTQTNQSYNQIDMDYSKLTANLLGVSFINGSNLDVYAVLFTVVPATKVITAGSPQQMVVGSFSFSSIAFDPLVSTRLAVGGATNNTGSSYVYTGQISGTAIVNTYNARTITQSSYNSRGIAVKYLIIGDGSSSNSVLIYAISYEYGNCCGTYYYSFFNSGIAASTAYNAAYTWQTENQIMIGFTDGVYNLAPIALVSGQNNKMGLPYGRTGSGTATLVIAQATITSTNLDSTKIIGIANASASASASVVVNLWGGIDTHQSSLTPNTTYYVNATGTLTTSSTAPSLSMGKALTASTILLKTTP